MKRNKRQVGGYYEEKAAAYLEGQGLHIIERNYRCRSGELDLIARDGKYLVFIEVKYRADGVSGSSLAAVDKAKQRVISKTACFYLLKHYKSVEVACRFDVVGFDGEELHWIKNAFDYCT